MAKNALWYNLAVQETFKDNIILFLCYLGGGDDLLEGGGERPRLAGSTELFYPQVGNKINSAKNDYVTIVQHS